MKHDRYIALASLGVALAFILCLCTGCVTEHGSATPGYYTPSTPLDPAARFGIFIEGPQPVVIVPEK